MNLQDLLTQADALRFRSQTQQAIPLYQQVADQSSAAGDFKQAGHALHMIGVCYKMDNQTKEAIEALTTALDYYSSHGYPEKEGVVLCDIGSTYEYAGDLSKAQDHILLAIAKLETTNDRGAYGIALARLGSLRIKQEDPTAVTSLTKAIEVLRTTDAWFFLATALGYLGEYYALHGEYQKGSQFLEEALAIYESHPEDSHARRRAQCRGGLAYCEAHLGNKESARAHLRFALAVILSDELTAEATHVLLEDIRAVETITLLAQQ